MVYEITQVPAESLERGDQVLRNGDIATVVRVGTTVISFDRGPSLPWSRHTLVSKAA